MTDFHINLSPPTTQHIVGFFEHNPVGQQAASDIASQFSSVSDFIDHSWDTRFGSVTQLPNGDTVSFRNVHTPRLETIAKAVAGFFGWNAA